MEDRSRAIVCFGPDTPIMILDYGPTNAQAEAQAISLGRVKRPEKTLLGLGSEADPLILD